MESITISENIAKIFEETGLAAICREHNGAKEAEDTMIKISTYFGNKIQLLEKQLNPSGDSWKERLVQERKDLLTKCIALKRHIDCPENKHNCVEWEMLRRQFNLMRDYIQALTDRCIYYGLIEAGDLGLHY